MLRSLQYHLRQRDWLGLLLELVIVVLGITLSLGLQEAREQRIDRATERRLLEGFAHELRLDKAELDAIAKHLQRAMQVVDSAFDPELRESLDAGALDQVMDHLLGYLNFTPSTATYSELRQSSAAGLIQNKTLLRNLIHLYERSYPRTIEWDTINREFVLNRMFPFIDEWGPRFQSQGTNAYAAGYHQAFEALDGDPRFANLARTSRVFKEGQRAVYQSLAQAVEAVLAELDSPR